MVCGILVFQTGIEHIPPAVEVESPNQWTVRYFPCYSNYLTSFPMKAATDKMQTNKCGSLPKNFCLGASKCWLHQIFTHHTILFYFGIFQLFKNVNTILSWILWSPPLYQLLNPDAGKNWRQQEKWAAEDEIVGQHHWLKGHESEQTLEDSKGQEGLACCTPRGPKE